MKAKKWQKQKQEAREQENERQTKKDLDYYEFLTMNGHTAQQAWRIITNNIFDGSI